MLLRNIEKTFNIKCNLDFDNSIQLESDSVAINLYRIIQEAVHNAIKHGKANEVYVSLIDRKKDYVLTIRNDGKELSFKKAGDEGMGIDIMKYRAKTINGKFKISNISKGGVQVRCSWPKSFQS